MAPKLKKGDLVKILNVHMKSDLGIIIKQGTNPDDTYMISRDEWLVHLTDGREVWLWTNEIINAED